MAITFRSANATKKNSRHRRNDVCFPSWNAAAVGLTPRRPARSHLFLFSVTLFLLVFTSVAPTKAEALTNGNENSRSTFRWSTRGSSSATSSVDADLDIDFYVDNDLEQRFGDDDQDRRSLENNGDKDNDGLTIAMMKWRDLRSIGKEIHCKELNGTEEIECNGTDFVPKSWLPSGTHRDMDTPGSPRFWIDLSVSAVLIGIAGLMSGLTMGLMSIDLINLQVLVNGGGSESEQVYARRIMPLVKRHHLLLVTLLVGNAAAMEALPIFLDRVLGPIFAILISVTAVLMFGEIIPQAICTRYGLAIGGHLFWLVWIIVILFFPIAWPISLFLDFVLGGSHTTYFRRRQLKELVTLHEKGDVEEKGEVTKSGAISMLSAGVEEGLTREEVNIIRGAMDMTHKTVRDTMTPINKVFVLNIKDRLDAQTMDYLLESGHSRIPVYRGEPSNIIGMLLVKKLIKIDPKDSIKIEAVELFRLPSVPADMPLYGLLKLFSRGGSHMAVVLDPLDHVTILGIITLEDVIEELIQAEIQDETDVYIDIAHSVKATHAVHAVRMMNASRSLASNTGSQEYMLRDSRGGRVSRRFRDAQLMVDVNELGNSDAGTEQPRGNPSAGEDTYLLDNSSIN